MYSTYSNFKTIICHKAKLSVLLVIPSAFTLAQDETVIISSLDLPRNITMSSIDDIDGDGLEELIFYSAFDDIIYSTELDPSVSNSYNPLILDVPALSRMKTVDFDSDGDVDIIVEGGNLFESIDGLVVFENMDGTFVSHSITSDNETGDFDVADIDGDGDLDFAMSTMSYYDPAFKLFINDGDWNFSIQILEEDGLRGNSAQFLDYNSDGLLDVKASFWYGGDVVVYINEGNSSFDPLNVISGVNEIDGSIMGDFDLDGDMDLVIHDWDNFPMRIYEQSNENNFEFISELPLESRVKEIDFLDLNNDGSMDLVFSETTTSTLHRLSFEAEMTMDHDTLSRSTYVPSSLNFYDFGNDNDYDMIILSSSDAKISHLFNNEGTFELEKTIGIIQDPLQVEWVDWDLDGDLDLLCLTGEDADAGPLFPESNSRLIVLERTDSGEFLSHTISGGLRDPKMFEVIDFNADGLPDVANIYEHPFGNNPDLHLTYNLGSFDYLNTVIDGESSEFKSFVVGDLNDDDFYDFVAYAAPDGLQGRIVIMIQNIDGTYTQSQILVPFGVGALKDLQIIDMDQDGLTDIIGLSSTNNGVNDYIAQIFRQTSDLEFEDVFLENMEGDMAFDHFSVLDINLDGELDIVAIEEEPGSIVVFNGESEPYSFNSTPISFDGLNPSSLECGFLDGNDFMDLVVTFSGSNSLIHYELINDEWIEIMTLEDLPGANWSSTVYSNDEVFLAISCNGGDYLGTLDSEDNLGIELNESISVSFAYPNPCSELLKIDMEYFSGTSDYEIFNMMGGLVQSGQLLVGESIDVRSLENAVYLLRIVDGDKISSYTFLKE